jgi:hypothetical protein
VSKIDPSGSALVYSTYLGGSGNDQGNGIAVDTAGNAYVTGLTSSTDFPTTPGAFQAVCHGNCEVAFVAKLNLSGSALVYSTYLGGSGGIDSGSGIAVDSAGNAYVIGGTTDSTDFPTMNPLQPVYGGNGDAFVAKLNPTGSALVYSTYLGGSGQDNGTGIAVDSAGNAYVTGYTSSTNFPTMNPLQPTYGGHGDAFVSKIDPSGSALGYSTYLGGSGDDYGYGIAVDGGGNAYVTGYTSSTNFPTMNPLQPTYGGGEYDAFVVKINPSGSALVYSTYLGGTEAEVGYGIAVDSGGNAYVTGATDSTDFPTMNPLQPANAGSLDAFVAKINPQPSDVALFPPQLDFGNQPVGIASSAQFSTLTNTSEVALTITSINVTGLNSSDFAQTNNCGTSVAPGKSCSVNVTFTPTATGNRSAAVSIADSAPDSPQSFSLTGIGTPPVVTLSPPSLTFGVQSVGTTSPPQIIQLSASGSISITSITVSGEFAQTNNCGSSLPAGEICQISVTFTPPVGGPAKGTLTISDSGAGSPQTAALSGTGAQPAATTTMLSSSLNPSTYGQAVTFTASVKSSYGPIPNGELVTFYDGSTEIGAGTTSGGVATFTTSSLTGKTHTIKATYSGDGRFKSSSGKITQVVDKDATSTTLVSSLNPSTYGQTATFTATVTFTGPHTPTGTVKFAGIGSAKLSGGVATITETWLNAGTYPITAEYEGDSDSAPSTSSVLDQVVNPVSTTTAITSSADPSSSGQTVTFTATVTSSTGAKATGTVTFTAGATTLGTVALNGTHASISTATLPVGSTTITATYNGATDYTGSSGSLTQTVN